MLWRSSAVRTDTDRPFPGRDLRSSSRNHVSSDQSQECFCTLLSFSFSLLSSSFLYIYLRIIDVVESSTALQRRFVPDSNVVPGRSVGSVARVHQAKLPALNLRLRLIQKCCESVGGLVISEPKAPLITICVRMTALCAQCILGSAVVATNRICVCCLPCYSFS